MVVLMQCLICYKIYYFVAELALSLTVSSAILVVWTSRLALRYFSFFHASNTDMAYILSAA